MQPPLTRREFLKLGGLSLAALAWSGAPEVRSETRPDIPSEEPSMPQMAGRVTRRRVEVYAEPNPASRLVHRFERDAILHLHEEVRSPYGPAHNLRWYRLGNGYVHSAYIQRVEAAHMNTPLTSIPRGGLLGEVTVPYAQTLYKNKREEWIPMYRLYYGSVHWITGLEHEPPGGPWYRLTDELLRVEYLAPATSLRPVSAEELAPISPEVPLSEKRVKVYIERQRLVAYEGRRPVFSARTATGRRYMETPSGAFNINRKCPSKHMGNGALNSNLNAFELVGVPWVAFFHTNGVAFHGAYWHDNFGAPMSQGCVNLRMDDAKWLFRWLTPAYDGQAGFRAGRKLLGAGTEIRVE